MDQERQAEDDEQRKAECEPRPREQKENRTANGRPHDRAAPRIGQFGQGATKRGARTGPERQLDALVELIQRQPTNCIVIPERHDGTLAICITDQTHAEIVPGRLITR